MMQRGDVTMRKIHYRLSAMILALLCALAPQVWAAAEQDPYQLVQQTTERVIAIIGEAKGYYQKEPDRFHKQVESVMSGVVDFDSFARGVMGSYAGAQRFQTLKTEQEKAQFRDQIKRFTITFKHGLIETYAKGLLKFDGQRIETLPPRNKQSGDSVSVVQNIYGGADKPYVVQYSLRKDRDGSWKVRNVVIEGINLGQTYRNQFAASAEQYRGDIDKVIANWKVEPTTEGGVAHSGADKG
jgi:phospholipid transport system substrate-binding protein